MRTERWRCIEREREVYREVEISRLKVKVKDSYISESTVKIERVDNNINLMKTGGCDDNFHSVKHTITTKKHFFKRSKKWVNSLDISMYIKTREIIKKLYLSTIYIVIYIIASNIILQ